MQQRAYTLNQINHIETDKVPYSISFAVKWGGVAADRALAGGYARGKRTGDYRYIDL